MINLISRFWWMSQSTYLIQASTSKLGLAPNQAFITQILKMRRASKKLLEASALRLGTLDSGPNLNITLQLKLIGYSELWTKNISCGNLNVTTTKAVPIAKFLASGNREIGKST